MRRGNRMRWAFSPAGTRTSASRIRPLGIQQKQIAELPDRFDDKGGMQRAGDGGSAGKAPARKARATRPTPAARCAHICAAAAAAASLSTPPAAAYARADGRGWPGDAPRAADSAAPGGRRSPARRCGCPAGRSAARGRPQPSLSVRRPLPPASRRQNACQEKLPVLSCQMSGHHEPTTENCTFGKGNCGCKNSIANAYCVIHITCCACLPTPYARVHPRLLCVE